jgi:hypothetical protein
MTSMPVCITKTDSGPCGRVATILQRGGPVCVEHATDKAALRARLGTLEAESDPNDAELLEAHRIEHRLGKLDGHG